MSKQGKGKRIDFHDFLDRLTGFSTPWFGFSWEASTSDRKVANRVITFLEDRRVLYNPYDLEAPEHVIDSILEIRTQLTTEMNTLDRSSQLADHLSAMRAACRKFLTTIEPFKSERRMLMSFSSYHSWTFYTALGELRGVFGIHIAQIATKYQIDVEPELASTMPIPPNNELDSGGPETLLEYLP